MAFDPKGNERVVVTGIFKHGTDKATLMFFEDVGEAWLPNSQFNPPSVEVEKDKWAMFIPRWLADAKGMNYEEYDPEDWESEVQEGVSAEPESPVSPFDDEPPVY